MTIKDDELFGLSKIPESVIIKEQAFEIGQLKAYITELEDKLKDLAQRQGLTPDEKMELKKGEYYENHKKQLRELSEALRKCKKEREALFLEVVKLKNNSK